MKPSCVRERFVRVGRTRGLILEAGEGPTVVVLASMLVLARSYLWPLSEFSKRFRTIIVQPPGGGRATRLACPWSMEEYARWTGELLEVLRLEDVTLIGHSNSGPVATILAAGDARRIGRIVLADSIGGDESFSLTRILFARAIDCFLEHELTLFGWSHVLLNALFHFRNFFEQVRLSARTDLRQIAPRVKVPALVAWGARDHTMPLRCARVLRSLLPRTTSYVSRTGSHDWLVDRPGEFAQALETFVRSTNRFKTSSPRSHPSLLHAAPERSAGPDVQPS